MSEYRSASGSAAEDLFIDLFSETFGPERTGYLYSQYPFTDIYQNSRYADFLLNDGGRTVAIEIDDAASHDTRLVSGDKAADDLLKQNSMIHMGWDVYRWTVRTLQKQPDSVKDELRVFLGSDPRFRALEEYLPRQSGAAVDFGQLVLRDYQNEALEALAKLRAEKKTIALLHHATGTGKTVTAVSDARRCGGRVLFAAHTVELVHQAAETFRRLWPEVSVGCFVESAKETETHVVCASIQSLALNLELFREDAFDYIIIDEAHHAAAETYQRVLAYFRPGFTLGLTATPERTDDADILEIFRNTAHRMDLKEAVEQGALVPVRCVRIRTNIDMSDVRFHSVRYNIRDLDVKICVTERNRLIVRTWLDYVRGKRTVVFCASVRHADEIAALFRAEGIDAEAVSGFMKPADRKEVLDRFASGKLKVLCACDLLNEGWDCPETEVLFMARPTMSKMLYTQQLGRGMRKSEGKESLIVFDFVDNASMFNAPYTMHSLFRLKTYRPGELVLAPPARRLADEELYRRGEKPEAILDWPVSTMDTELVDIFNWQEEAAGMLSQMELVRRLDVQEETVSRYIRENRLIPDLTVPMSESRNLHYFKAQTMIEAAEAFGWHIIDDSNRRDAFMEMVRTMDMSYSYKPVLLKGFLHHADARGRVKLDDLAAYFRGFYRERKEKGLIPEKANSLFARDGYTDAEAIRNILGNPFRRFEDMSMMRHTKTLGIIEMDAHVWKKLTDADRDEIRAVCEEKLKQYYDRLQKKAEEKEAAR